MNSTTVARLIIGFLAAALLTVVWGSVVQTQYNLAALSGIGVDIGLGTNLRTTFSDIFSGFSVTYAGYMVLPALLVAFSVAWLVVQRTGARYLWLGLAGGLAILAVIPLVNWLSPLALLIGASRDVSCIILMAVGGVAGGLLFAWITRPTTATDSRHSQPTPSEIHRNEMKSTMTRKLNSGQHLPEITVPQLVGGRLRLGTPVDDHDWQMVVVYRGKHCPICKTYLAQLNRLAPEFANAGVGVVAVSSDPKDRARSFADEIGASFPIGYDLSVDQMHSLGLYISEPSSEKETDRPFAEPGVFVINADGLLQLVDISNAPFARPDLDSLAKGLQFIRDNDYPIRGRLVS